MITFFFFTSQTFLHRYSVLKASKPPARIGTASNFAYILFVATDTYPYFISFTQMISKYLIFFS